MCNNNLLSDGVGRLEARHVRFLVRLRPVLSNDNTCNNVNLLQTYIDTLARYKVLSLVQCCPIPDHIFRPQNVEINSYVPLNTLQYWICIF